MRGIPAPRNGGSAKSFELPRLYRSPNEAAAMASLFEAKLAELQVTVADSSAKQADAIEMYNLMNNSSDRREATAHFATLWQREATLRALLDHALLEAQPTYRSVGNVALAPLVEASVR